METSGLKEFVDELRVQWKQLWQNRIDDKIKAEGLASQDYSKLFVERGTVIIATRDYKPPVFIEILQQHMLFGAERIVPPNPTLGGWGRFIRTVITKQKHLIKRQAPPKPHRKRDQQLKKGGRGWLHFRMR